jgi:hypothetical protein
MNQINIENKQAIYGVPPFRNCWDKRRVIFFGLNTTTRVQ